MNNRNNVALCLLAMLVISPVLGGQSTPGSVFFIGHSLVNHDMPRMVAALAEDAGLDHEGGRQIINGATLWWQWDNSSEAEGMDARQALPSGDWDVLVMTEAVPLDNHLAWSDTYQYAGNFHDLSLSANAQTRTYIYETWHCINSGLPAGCDWDDGDDVPWRERLDADLVKWQGIADHLNSEFAGPEVHLAPAGQAMALLHDLIDDGQVPGLDHVFDLFSDDIHLTDVGNYFIALVMYATIYRVSPEGLTWEISDQWGSSYDLPPQSTAQALQSIAWQSVETYFGASAALFTDRFEQ